MNANAVKNAVLAILATIGGGIAAILGGWDEMLETLIIFMAADYLTGLAVALVFHKSKKTVSGSADSRTAFKGLLRKAAILLAVLVAVRLDVAMKTAFCRSAVMLFFIGSEGISILENLGLMGVPYPKFLQNALDTLKKDGEEGKKE